MSVSITNAGGDMTTAQRYSVFSAALNKEILSGSIQLKANDTFNTSQPFSNTQLGTITLTLSTPGSNSPAANMGSAVCVSATPTNTPVTPTSTATNTPVTLTKTETPTLTATVLAPKLSGNLTCVQGAVSVSITNAGGDMTSPQQYSVFSAALNKEILGGSIQLKANDTFNTSSQAFSNTQLGTITLTLSTPGGNAAAINMGSAACPAPGATSTSVTPTSTPTAFPPGFTPSATPVVSATPTIKPPQNRVAWKPITVGAATCQNWLIYHTNQFQTDQNKNIEIMRLGNIPGLGSSPDDLTQTRGQNVKNAGPSLSPDRAWVAFASTRDGGTTTWDIYIAPTSGKGAVQRMTYSDGLSINIAPVWSPDGLSVAYESFGGSGGAWNLHVFNVKTGADSVLTSTPATNFEPYWSPDSQSLIFESNREGSYQIYKLDVATPNAAPVRLTSGTDDNFNPSYSPDGKKIAFRTYTKANPTISVLNVMDSDGTNLKTISDPSASATNESWSPSGDLLAYQSTLHGQPDVFVYQLSTDKTRLVTDNADKIAHYAPTWYCGSDTLVFTSDVRGDPNVFSTNALPISAPPIKVATQGHQLTFLAIKNAADEFAQNSPQQAEEASRTTLLPSATNDK